MNKWIKTAEQYPPQFTRDKILFFGKDENIRVATHKKKNFEQGFYDSSGNKLDLDEHGVYWMVLELDAETPKPKKYNFSYSILFDKFVEKREIETLGNAKKDAYKMIEEEVERMIPNARDRNAVRIKIYSIDEVDK